MEDSTLFTLTLGGGRRTGTDWRRPGVVTRIDHSILVLTGEHVALWGCLMKRITMQYRIRLYITLDALCERGEERGTASQAEEGRVLGQVLAASNQLPASGMYLFSRDTTSA